VFEAESATAPGVDLGAITDRMEIRKAVQSGNMEEAIERVNDLNPQASCTRWPVVPVRMGHPSGHRKSDTALVAGIGPTSRNVGRRETVSSTGCPCHAELLMSGALC